MVCPAGTLSQNTSLVKRECIKNLTVILVRNKKSLFHTQREIKITKQQLSVGSQTMH